MNPILVSEKRNLLRHFGFLRIAVKEIIILKLFYIRFPGKFILGYPGQG